MVRIIIILFLSIQLCYGQHNSQYFFGRSLDSAAILTNDIADSSITFKKIKYITGPRLVGNPAATYDSLKLIKLGTNLSFSNDTLNASGASGNVNQNGNSYGTSMVVGTNDNNTLDLETNGVSRLGITSGATTGGELTSSSITTNTATINNAFTVRTTSSGTAAAGFGNSILFQGESSTTDNQDMTSIGSYWNIATDASRGAYMSFKLVKNASALAEYLLVSANGDGELKVGNGTRVTLATSSLTTETAYTVGNSSSTLTLGGSSGSVHLTSSANSSTAILLNGSNSNTPCVKLGNSNYTFTSSTKQMLFTDVNYTAASGTGILNCVDLAPIYNLTGTASAQQNGININPTLTSLTAATFVGVNLPFTHANAYGIMQSGTSKNVFAGKTTFGSTTAPTSLLMLAAGTATANTAPLKLTSGTNLTTPETGAVEYDGTNFFITNSAPVRYTIAKILTGSGTLDFALIGTNVSADLTITVTGASDGDEVILGVPNAAVNINTNFTAWVSASNTVTVRFNNYSAGNSNPASGTFKASVIKR